MDNLLTSLPEDVVEKVEQKCLRLQEVTEAYYTGEIEQIIIERRKLYESTEDYYKKKFPFLTQLTTFTSTDCIDTVEWAMPSVVRVFFGAESIFNLVGVTEEDEESATNMQELIDYQIQRKSNGFVELHDWFKTCLIENFAVLKASWDREEVIHETQEVYVNPDQYAALQQQPPPKKFRIISEEQLDEGLIHIVYEVYSYKKNQPRFENIPISEFRFTPDAKSLEECRLVAHKKRVLGDYLRRQENSGIYINVEDAMDDYGDDDAPSQYELQNNPALGLYDESDEDDEEDNATKKFTIWEDYVRIDIDGNGLLEDCIVTMLGKKAIRIIINPLGSLPFFAITAIRDPKKIFPKKGLVDLIGPLQDLKTALLCQIIFNVAVSNDKQAFVNIDAVIDVDEFTEGKKAVRVQGPPKEAVFWAPIEPLPPQVFSFIEYIETMKENRTGITRYNQGLDANTLNKTATGVTQIMNAANQRIELICRLIAEGGLVPFIRHLIKLNQMYVEDDVVIRVTNKPKRLTYDDLNGEIDIIVNAGIGTANKQQDMQNYKELLSIYPLLMQMGIATPYHVAYVVGRMIELMGHKNIQDFVVHPDNIKKMLEQAQQNPQPEEDKGPEQKPVSKSISFKDMPPGGKIQMAAQAGIQLDPNEVLNQAAIEAVKILGGARSGRDEGGKA